MNKPWLLSKNGLNMRLGFKWIYFPNEKQAPLKRMATCRRLKLDEHWSLLLKWKSCLPSYENNSSHDHSEASHASNSYQNISGRYFTYIYHILIELFEKIIEYAACSITLHNSYATEFIGSDVTDYKLFTYFLYADWSFSKDKQVQIDEDSVKDHRT